MVTAELRASRDLLVNSLVASPLFPARLRWRALRALGLAIEPSTISPNCFFGGRAISIGRGSFLNRGTFLDNSAPVSIGDQCYLGPHVSVLTSSHEVGPTRRRAGRAHNLPVVIGSGAWIGANV
ncbi:MAG: acyltransferase, partial [Actinomycetota bacterium]|nr:acyltransferase [Actinomycetota bacterium]